jgi:type II restriction/modification system DNA methylase subunit YeeA
MAKQDNDPIQDFVNYCKSNIIGDEKGEAQTFLDKLFVAYGWADGHKQAGAILEFRIKDTKKRTTNFGDLVWPKKVLIEMKKRGENLAVHLQQATDYWFKLAEHRPKYVILCNFDEFWIYDFDIKVYDPIDIVKLEELPSRKEVFGFLFPKAITPVFGRDKEDVTEKAAEQIAAMFKSMVKRKIPPHDALHYSLQCIVSLFAEDVGLLPNKIFSQLVEECSRKGASSYDLLGELFAHMNREGITPAGRYEGVDYFNGGLFKVIKPIELTEHEISLLEAATYKNWQHVNPAIFGSFFETNLDKELRHELGAHYTHEIDIKRIVNPVIVQPWTSRIEEATELEEYLEILTDLTKFKVLDPACGSGNFLFVAFRELKLLEKKVFSLILENAKPSHKNKFQKFLTAYPFVNTKQFYGLDINPTAVEIAKVTLMVAKELSILESDEHLYDNKFKPLPLDNLDENIICTDALITEKGNQTEWPEVDAIIGNPPFQARSKMLSEFGREYLNKLWDAYPEMNRYADFCTYWFYKAFKSQKKNSYAGLVATNTIKQNNSRESSLDYILENGGEIIDAVSSMPWAGDAAVHVSLISWKKGKHVGEKHLYNLDDKENLQVHSLEFINSSLSLFTDVSKALSLPTNKKPKKCFKGQKHGHASFLVDKSAALKFIGADKKNSDVLKPYLIGDELVSATGSQPSRFVIDFSALDIIQSSKYKQLFKIIEDEVLPVRKRDAEKEKTQNDELLKKNPRARVSNSYQQYFSTWWQIIGKRQDLLKEFKSLKRYIACSEVSLRPIFEFISTEIRPNATINVFTFDDYYSFGIIQSNLHWLWWTNKGSTLGETYRYTNDPVWDTYPWPQKITQNQAEKVAEAAMNLHKERTRTLRDNKMSLRELYRLLEQPGKNPIKDLHSTLNKAVIEAYGFDEKKDLLAQLLELNLSIANNEQNKISVQGPGWPESIKGKEKFVTDDCVEFEN